MVNLHADNGLPESTHHDRVTHVAVGTATAHLMLATGPTTPDPVITDWLAHTTPSGSKAHLSQLLARWDTASPALQGELLKRVGPHLGAAFQLRYGTATSTPRRPRSGHGRTRAATVPSLFWRGWALRLNPQGIFDPLPYRQALSVLLQTAGLGDLDYATARTLLGLPPASGAVCGHFTKKLREVGAWDAVLLALSQLARKLDDHPAPIDYGRRRRWRRISTAALDRKAWQAACTHIRHRTSDRQEHFAQLHLIELLTASHPYYYPEPLTLPPAPDGQDYTAFVFSLPAPLSAHLHQQAQTLLRRLRIDEPVTWEPPLDWADNIAWPGPDPDDVGPEQLWALARAGLTRRAIATRLHITPEHVHLAATRHPKPWTQRHIPKPSKENQPTTPLSNHELRGYIDQGLSPGQIARLTRSSYHHINTLLTSKGICPPTPQEILRALDPEWLREQYEDNHRPFADIAAELGIPPPELVRHARTHGLPIRYGISAHKHILADHGGPEAFPATIWTAFATRGAAQRIRRLLAIPGHPDLNHAANHLGIRKAVLAHQIDQLEHAVGATLLATQPDPGDIRLTSTGEKFAQDAIPVLAMLDRTDNATAPQSHSASQCSTPSNPSTQKDPGQDRMKPTHGRIQR